MKYHSWRQIATLCFKIHGSFLSILFYASSFLREWINSPISPLISSEQFKLCDLGRNSIKSGKSPLWRPMILWAWGFLVSQSYVADFLFLLFYHLLPFSPLSLLNSHQQSQLNLSLRLKEESPSILSIFMRYIMNFPFFKQALERDRTIPLFFNEQKFPQYSIN